jgi:hypothetical protein
MNNVAIICPHCGGQNGQHPWAGSGECPGRSTHPSEYPNINPTSQVEILQRLDVLEFQVKLDILKRLDALENYQNGVHIDILSRLDVLEMQMQTLITTKNR